VYGLLNKDATINHREKKMSDVFIERPPPSGEGLTFEKVWAFMQENERKYFEAKLEMDKRIEESRLERERASKEYDRKLEESRLERERERKEYEEQKKEADKKYQEFSEWMKQQMLNVENHNKKYDEMTDRFGEMVEHLVAPSIEEKFNELGYHFSEVAPEGHKIIENRQVKAQIDILLENGETVMAVEVKSKPHIKDIQKHIERLEILREYRRKAKDKRKIEGAIAGAVFKDNVKKAAQKAGLYVIVQTGDTMQIEVPNGWKPKAW
jgi:hypothetical protein